MSLVTASIQVTKIKWDAAKVSRRLASMSSVRSGMEAIANTLLAEAQQNISAAAKPAGIKYERYHGKYFSASPSAVAAQVKIKDTQIRKTTSAKEAGRVAPVVLVVSDHPYSQHYESGLDEFSATNFMSRALDKVSKKSGVTRRPAK